jgi:hypothetical protein
LIGLAPLAMTGDEPKELTPDQEEQYSTTWEIAMLGLGGRAGRARAVPEPARLGAQVAKMTDEQVGNAIDKAVQDIEEFGKAPSKVERPSGATGVAQGAAAAERQGEHVVLGLRDYGTRELAERLGAKHLLQHPDWMKAVKAAARDPGTRITVNLSGFSGEGTWNQVMGAVSRGLGGAPKYTEWEMAQLFQAGRLPTVEFVNSAGEAIANPFK